VAADIVRTAPDDAHDALRALDQAEREITCWRAHLERLQAGAQVPVAMQARRCASIVSALVGDAVNRTADAVCHAELPADALPA
jgi:porphobilinogen deaminase